MAAWSQISLLTRARKIRASDPSIVDVRVEARTRVPGCSSPEGNTIAGVTSCLRKSAAIKQQFSLPKSRLHLLARY